MGTSKILKHPHQTVLKDYYCSVYFNGLDITSAFVKIRFEQPYFTEFLKLESVLLHLVNNDSIDDGPVSFINKTYNEDLDTDAIIADSLVLKVILNPCEINYFRDIYKTNLISKMVKPMELLLVNRVTSCTAEQPFSTTSRLKAWLRLIIKNKWFNFLSVLNIHKTLNDKINLADVGDKLDFVSFHDSRYQYFGTFEASSFTQYILLHNFAFIFPYHVYCLCFSNIFQNNLCSFKNIIFCFVLLT